MHGGFEVAECSCDCVRLDKASRYDISCAGAFNDRVRGGAIGGSPFAPPGLQGVLTGLFVDPNSHTATDEEDPQATLEAYTDVVKLGADTTLLRMWALATS